MNRFPHNMLSHAQSNVDTSTLQAFELSSFHYLSASEQHESIVSHEIRIALYSQLPSTSQNFRDSKEKSQNNHTQTIRSQKKSLKQFTFCFWICMPIKCQWLQTNTLIIQMNSSVSGDSQKKEYFTKDRTFLPYSIIAQQLQLYR